MTISDLGTSRNSQPALHHPALPAITSAIAAILLYAITLGGTYIYDDIPIVRDDPRMHNTALWGQLWTRSYDAGGVNLYRPLVSSSYAIEWLIHGDRPWMFHLVNVLLHAGVAATVAELTRRGLGRTKQAAWAALMGGCLFAAHPLHVEAVANIVGRAELACALAVLAGLVILAKRPLTNGRAIAIITCGVIGMLCKEQGVLSPLLWLLFGRFAWWDQKLEAAERKVVTHFILITTWLWATYLIGREHFLKFEWDPAWVDPTIQPLLLSVGLDRALMPVVLIGHYAALFLWPAHLSLDYGGDVIGSHAHLADPYLWLGTGAVVCWCVAILMAWRRNAGFILFCLLAMAVTYGVVGNIVTLIGTNFAERLIYLPSAFLLMAIGAALAKLPKKICVPFAAAALLLSSLKTSTAARDWNNPLTLYQHSLAATPRSIPLHLLLAEEYRRRDNIAAADAALDEVCAQYPNYWRVWMFRASAAMDDGDLPTARRDLRRSMQLNTNPLLLSVQARLNKLDAASEPGRTIPPKK